MASRKKPQVGKIINSIEDIRRVNNNLWMDVLRIAMAADPKATKTVLRSINENDSEIGYLLAELAE